MNLFFFKEFLKQNLYRANVFHQIDMIRYFPEMVSWLKRGCSGVAPIPLKRAIVSSYLKQYNLKYFFETGTYLGDTLGYIARDRDIMCTSIELDEALFCQAQARFSRYANVTILQGDSGVILPQCLYQLCTPALFWLDGHYSGGITGRGKSDTSISTELEAILESPIKEHIILIDDARYFVGKNDYPHLDQLIKQVRDKSDYKIEVSADIIRLTPHKLRENDN